MPFSVAEQTEDTTSDEVTSGYDKGVLRFRLTNNEDPGSGGSELLVWDPCLVVKLDLC